MLQLQTPLIFRYFRNHWTPQAFTFSVITPLSSLGVIYLRQLRLKQLFRDVLGKMGLVLFQANPSML